MGRQSSTQSSMGAELFPCFSADLNSSFLLFSDTPRIYLIFRTRPDSAFVQKGKYISYFQMKNSFMV